MSGVLGEKIGEGVFADVHAWAPGKVVKLFKANVPSRTSRWESRMTRAIFAAGGPAPEVLDEVSVEDRFGIVLPRLDGPTLLQLTRGGAMAFEQAGAILASLYQSVHETPPPPEVVSLRDMMIGSLRLSGGAVPPHIATGIVALIERLRPGNRLCHTDLHPGNVIMTADGPRIIDWAGAVRAPAALDLAHCHIMLAELAPQVADNPQRPQAINAAAQSEYASLVGMSQAELTAAVAPYLPIALLRTLLAGVVNAQRERLLQSIEAALRLVE